MLERVRFLSSPRGQSVFQLTFIYAMTTSLPQVGAIEIGRVSRIEPYGAFVQLQGFNLRGLIHISQVSTSHVDRVEDFVQVNDEVWVKILDVEKDDVLVGKVKLRLSMKNIAQDGSAREQEEAQKQHEQLAQNLSSSIGMAFARDPMERGSNLVIKGLRRTPNLINGYALVDDDEGEAAPLQQQQQQAPVAKEPTATMGRGRGATLPAWMTQAGDRLGRGKKNEQRDKESDDESSRRKGKHRRREKESRGTDASQRRRHRKKRKIKDPGGSDDELKAESKKRHKEKSRKKSRAGSHLL